MSNGILDGASGLRVGELLGLKWEDVDFERNVIHIFAKAISLNELANALRLWKIKTVQLARRLGVCQS